MKYFAALNLLVLCAACSTPPAYQPTAERKVASLDNDSETILDPKLETPSSVNEDKKFRDVAATIAAFVKKDSFLRENHPGQDAIQKDLPQLGQDGKLIPDAMKERYATRDVHRKTHGCYAARLDVSSSVREDLNNQLTKFIDERTQSSAKNPLPELITDYDQLGIFKPGESYDAIVRYSNGNPGYRHDHEPDARGMAMKILPAGTLSSPVPQMAVETLDSATLLDILTINFPTFFVNDPIKYLKLNEQFLKSAQDYKGVVSSQVSQLKSLYGTGLSRLERKMAFLSNGSVIYSPLYQKYYSMVPSRLGRRGEARAVKYAFFPQPCAGEENQFRTEAPTQWAPWTRRRDFALISKTKWAEAIGTPITDAAQFPHDYLREHLRDHLTQGDACFALMFQLYRDQESTNIEDSTDIWLSDTTDRDNWYETIKPGGNLGKAYYDKTNKKSFSPYVKVATLKILKIDKDYPTENTKTCEDMSFNPWNGKIEFHKPLGVVSRMKRRVYNASRHTRNQINEVPSKDWERR